MAQKRLGVRGGINLSAPFTARGEETLVDAQNYVQDTSGVLKSRRGYTRSDVGIAAPVYKCFSHPELLGSTGRPGPILVNNGGVLFPTELRYFDGDGAVVSGISGGFINSNLAYRMQNMVARGNLYATEDNCVFAMPTVLSTAAAKLRRAGQVMGTGVSASYTNMVAVPPLGTAWLAAGASAAYRVVWGREDTTGEILGAPSGRTIIYNFGGAAAQPLLYIVPPKACNTTNTPLTAGVDWVDIYRSKSVDYLTGAEPDDEMNLVLRYFPTAGEIAGGFIQVADVVPDEVRQHANQFLYTNADTGDVGPIGPNGVPTRGIVLGNETPPKARTMAVWNNRGWYADSRTRPTYSFSFIALPTPGDQILINGFAFPAVGGPIAFPNQFEVITTGTLSFNIMQTAQRFVAAVNSDPNFTTCYAQYDGFNETDPGKVTIYRRDFGADFTVNVVAANPFSNPDIPSVPTSGTADYPGRLYYSKDGEPEAVPVVNFFQVGQVTSRIHALAARRNYLYCFTDDGLYRVTGSTESDFGVELVEPRCHVVARETVCVGSDGLIYAICREGIAQIDDSGVTWIQEGIEPIWRFLLDRRGESAANKYWYAVSSPRWQTVTFMMDATSSAPTGGFVWNIPTRSWTRIAFPSLGQPTEQAQRSCGCIQSNTGKQVYFNGTSTTSDSRAMFENLDFGSNYHVEMTPNGTAGGIGHTVSWWPFMEAPNVKSTWREVHASFWAELSTNIDLVPNCSVIAQTGSDTSTVAATTPVECSPPAVGGVPIPQSLISRAMIPSPVARARSIAVTLTDLAAAFSSMPVECITIIYEPYTTKEVA